MLGGAVGKSGSKVHDTPHVMGQLVNKFCNSLGVM